MEVTSDRFKNVDVSRMSWGIAARIPPGQLRQRDVLPHLQTKNEQENSGEDGLEQQYRVVLATTSKHFRGKWGEAGLL